MTNNILHIANGYWASSLYRDLFLSLGKSVKQTVFVPIRSNDQQKLFPINHNNIQLIHSPVVTSAIYRILFHKKIQKTTDLISKNIKVGDFDILHAHTLFSDGAAALFFYKTLEKPYIVTVRNTDINVFFKYLIHLRKTGIEILKNAEKIVFLSIPYKERLLNEYVPEDYKKTFEDKSVVIPNGINKFWLENINNNPISTDINTNNIRALYAGEIRRNKNIDGTIKALQILNNKGYNFHFDIVGMGLHDQKSYLRTIIKTANKTNFITLHPVANQAGLLNFYRNSHLFIMPSFTESFGLVYLEALSQGVPVIYSINEGFDKSFKNGVIGSSADPHNPDSIATAIEKILNDYRQIQRNCIEAVNRFDWEIIAEDYIRIYNEIN